MVVAFCSGVAVRRVRQYGSSWDAVIFSLSLHNF